MPPDAVPPSLESWVRSVLIPDEARSYLELMPLAGDASSRSYFRLRLDGRSYIVAHAPPETERNEAFIAVRALLDQAGVCVPTLFASNLERGYLLLEDLGDGTLLPALDADSVDGYYGLAFELLLRFVAIDTGERCLAAYDEALLREELGRFDTWFLGGLLNYSLTDGERDMLEALYTALVQSALAQPRVFVHRDFHSRNLMRRGGAQLAVIDFQDAVAGPLTYDLVSLLRDCYVRWPAERVRDWTGQYWHRLQQATPVAVPDHATFQRWFDWMGLQRHLKVLGTFARLSVRDGRSAYLADLPRVINYTLEVLTQYAPEEPAFADCLDWYERRVAPAIARAPWGRPPGRRPSGRRPQ